MRETVLIASSRSRNGQAHFETAKTMLAERGIRVAEAYIEPNKKKVRKRVRAAIAKGYKLICVACGDGGQTFVMGEFAHSKAVLGVLPAGTGNSFALSLGIESLESAIDAIDKGTETKIDLGIANGCYFANFATIGLGSHIAAETPHGLKKIIGPIAYGVSTIAPLLTHQAFECRIKAKGNDSAFSTYQIIVANGRFYGHQPLASDATIVDGELNFFAHTGTTKWDAAQTYIALLRGTQEKLKDARSFTAKKITIKAKPSQLVAIDGSTLCKTPVCFEIAPKALRVMVPHAFAVPPIGLKETPQSVE